MILGIDASNIRAGGGVTHLVELLKAAQPNDFKFNKVVVWGGSKTLEQIEDRPWLTKVFDPLLDRSLIYRIYWQRFKLTKLARTARCNLLFIPGGSYSGPFRPFIAMSQNLLPFEWREMKRYGLSWQFIRLLLLRFSQGKTFRRADGVIFLTEYARNCITKRINIKHPKTMVIPHGINYNFKNDIKKQKDISFYNKNKLYKILYVSTIDKYKHQGNVVLATTQLLEQGYPIQLDLVGGAYSNYLVKLKNTLKNTKFFNSHIYYHGIKNNNELIEWYKNSDLFLFASTCENMPIILMEAMIAGLPIASSNYGPMPEILHDGGIYFDPEDVQSILTAIQILIVNPKLREDISNKSSKLVSHFNWKKCANETFNFFEKILIR